jgi:hypothetical protein
LIDDTGDSVSFRTGRQGEGFSWAPQTVLSKVSTKDDVVLDVVIERLYDGETKKPDWSLS